MPQGEQVRVTVVLRGRHARVEVLGRRTRHRGHLVGEPERLRVGDEVHILIERRGGLKAALLGRVEAFEGASRRLRLQPGASFELAVSLVRQEGACLPPAAVFGATPTPAPKERTWPGAPREASSATTSAVVLGTAELDALMASEARFAPDEGARVDDELDDDDVTAKLPGPVVSEPEPPEEVSGVVGNLAVMNLVDLVQSMEICSKTARVDVAPQDGAEGHLFFEHGALVHAFWNHLVGEEAFFHLIGVERGLFRVRMGRTTPERSIETPSTYLVIEAARRLDEAAREDEEATRTQVAPAPPAITGVGERPQEG